MNGKQKCMQGEVRSNTKRKTDSKGMTLVELIVTFAVAAIFMAAAAILVVPATKMTMQVRGMNRVHDDAAIIMETIVNELSYADSFDIVLTDKYPDDATNPYNGYYQKVKYNDKGGNQAEMSVTDDGEARLQIVYAAIDDGAGTLIRNEIDWSYGKGLYRDNVIMLGFQKEDPNKNIIAVRLTVTNTTSGYSYTQETDVRCMSVEANKIIEE